jgi:carbonic anhydrase
LKQKPKFLYFGCSDSRVPANSILGLGPGEVFVHRNIANMVPTNDLNALSVLEYAVAHLGVKDIIVAGHYDCGGVRAATKRQDLGLLEHWLRLIRDVYRLHKDHLDHIANLEERHHRLVELNVIEQCLNLYKTGVVQRKRLETAAATGGAEIYPRIHAMVFNPGEGILKKLDVNFEQRVGSLEHIYSIYDQEDI